MATVIDFLTADEIGQLLAHLLSGAVGGTEARWRRLIKVDRLPTWRYVRFNWDVGAGGTKAEREAIGKAVEVVRAEHPYVR